MPQEILPLNESEKNWILSGIDRGEALINALLGESMSAEKLLAQLDSAYLKWYESDERKTEDPNPIINAFGLTFGQHLCDQCNLGWVVVRDENGTDIAVHGQIGDILLFPTNFVAKRYERSETGFFEPLYIEVCQKISTLRELATVKKPWWKFW